MTQHVFAPKLVTTLRNYSRFQFAADVTAGVIVGVVALPLAIAFAIASGVRDLVRRTKRDRTLLLVSELQEQPRAAIRRSGLLEEIGHDNVLGSIDLALAVAQEYLLKRRPTAPSGVPAIS